MFTFFIYYYLFIFIYLFIYLLQNNVFYGSLEQDFRNIECQKSNIILNYVDNSVISPQFGRYLFFIQFFYFKLFLKN